MNGFSERNLVKKITGLLLCFLVLQACAESASNPAKTYSLKRSFEVSGRQGIAADADYYYVSGSKELYKYSKDGKLLLKNEDPFAGLPLPANHFGDIDVYNGEIYTGIENFVDGVGRDIQIAVYDTDSLQFKRAMNWNPDSGQVEVCGITVDPARQTVWMADWVNGTYLYKYDLTNGAYLGKLHLQPVPQMQQGIQYYRDNIYITADDGDADLAESDHLYRVNVATDATNAPVVLEKTFTEFKREGEIEGLAFDEKASELLVHMNRGRRIVLGMPKEFYPGYDREIHEIYVYQIQ